MFSCRSFFVHVLLCACPSFVCMQSPFHLCFVLWFSNFCAGYQNYVSLLCLVYFLRPTGTSTVCSCFMVFRPCFRQIHWFSVYLQRPFFAILFWKMPIEDPSFFVFKTVFYDTLILPKYYIDHPLCWDFSRQCLQSGLAVCTCQPYVLDIQIVGNHF